MDFKPNKPIYLQIVDFCFQKILLKEWLEDDRIPSVRELGSLLQVNPNTAMRAFEYMQTTDIIYLKRGTGYFVQKGAIKQVLKLQKDEFFENVLPETFESMRLLDISMDEVNEKYKKYKNR